MNKAISEISSKFAHTEQDMLEAVDRLDIDKLEKMQIVDMIWKLNNTFGELKAIIPNQ